MRLRLNVPLILISIIFHVVECAPRYRRWIPERYSDHDYGMDSSSGGGGPQNFMSYFWPEYFQQPDNNGAGGDYNGLYYRAGTNGGEQQQGPAVTDPVQMLQNVQTLSYKQAMQQQYPYIFTEQPTATDNGEVGGRAKISRITKGLANLKAARTQTEMEASPQQTQITQFSSMSDGSHSIESKGEKDSAQHSKGSEASEANKEIEIFEFDTHEAGSQAHTEIEVIKVSGNNLAERTSDNLDEIKRALQESKLSSFTAESNLENVPSETAAEVMSGTKRKQRVKGNQKKNIQVDSQVDSSGNSESDQLVVTITETKSDQEAKADFSAMEEAVLEAVQAELQKQHEVEGHGETHTHTKEAVKDTLVDNMAHGKGDKLKKENHNHKSLIATDEEVENFMEADTADEFTSRASSGPMYPVVFEHPDSGDNPSLSSPLDAVYPGVMTPIVSGQRPPVPYYPPPPPHYLPHPYTSIPHYPPGYPTNPMSYYGPPPGFPQYPAAPPVPMLSNYDDIYERYSRSPIVVHAYPQYTPNELILRSPRNVANRVYNRI